MGDIEQRQIEETQQPITPPEGEQPAAVAEAEAPEDAEAQDVEGGDAGEESGEEVPKEDEKHKRAGGWRRKIERLERERSMLLDQLAAQRSGAAPAPQSDKAKTAEEKAAEYIEGLVEKRITEREAQARFSNTVSKFQERSQAERARFEDFDEVVRAADIPTQSPLGQALLTSEHGPAIMYELAKSPAELARIGALPPLDAAREVGRLEARMSSATAAPKKTKSAVRPPVPPTSVNGSKASTRNLEDLSVAEYKRAFRSGRR